MKRSIRILVFILVVAVSGAALGCSKNDAQSKADLKVPDIPASSKADGKAGPAKGKSK
jgi:hypothetical protein